MLTSSAVYSVTCLEVFHSIGGSLCWLQMACGFFLSLSLPRAYSDVVTSSPLNLSRFRNWFVSIQGLASYPLQLCCCCLWCNIWDPRHTGASPAAPGASSSLPRNGSSAVCSAPSKADSLDFAFCFWVHTWENPIAVMHSFMGQIIILITDRLQEAISMLP